ncbi:MAG: hypothetical protein E7285_09495 [Lachnospiraceae bacterium]|nr:hypothetical protein [Lachnospiraceae bacterium]
MKLDDDFDLENEYEYDDINDEDDYVYEPDDVEDYEDDIYDRTPYGRKIPQNSSVMATAFISVSVVILLILSLVLMTNQSGKPAVSGNSVSSSYAQSVSDAEALHAENAQMSHSVDDLISGSSLTADDLTIWEDDYTESEEESVSVNESEIAEEETDHSLQTEIIHEDGSSEWVDINPYLDLNTYNFANLVYRSPLMMYYENNTRISYVGVDLSKLQDYVDFNELKSAGVDYVMLRLGQRGYQTGELSMDEYFYENLRRASEADLDVGVYFFSQAITEEEALEEAEYVISALSENEIQYPVVFYMDNVSGMECRIDDLDKMERTNIALTFMERIEEAGYIPMFYGDKEWLIQNLSLGSMIGYDIWYAEESDLPDFPYEFAMWQYTTSGRIEGISGNANLSICFIDYSVR